MTTLASLIILCTLGLGSLLIVSLVNNHQTRAKRARQRVKMLKFRVDALEEQAFLLDRIVDNRQIVHHVYDEAVALLDTMQQLDPGATYLKATAAHAQRRAAEFADPGRSRNINRAMASDAQIVRAKQALGEAARILRQRQSRGQLANEDLNVFLQDLGGNALFVEVISVIARGLMAMKRGDTLGAFAYYRRAQNQLLQSERRDDRRNRLIKELNEMLGKTRSLPSPDLIPEAAPIFQASPDNTTLAPMDTEKSVTDSGLHIDLANNSSFREDHTDQSAPA